LIFFIISARTKELSAFCGLLSLTSCLVVVIGEFKSQSSKQLLVAYKK